MPEITDSQAAINPVIGPVAPGLPQVPVKDLIAAQGTKSIDRPAAVEADFWPADESCDEFIAALRGWRSADSNPRLP